ncbi:polyprenyl synthetase family protein [Pseudomonas sp. HR96]|uniref:polyprenyl synthetase family protein n=1 Tax=Pseudomonas sp. HR96 TaxID=1027966 RepID=UPI002A74F785|nr:polyprenyl synthetase family protein [Pseudomonas sp. HR96]WPO98039.1 polyprenyl synthetase family protein [Pseudomonas sp. HR96]
MTTQLELSKHRRSSPKAGERQPADLTRVRDEIENRLGQLLPAVGNERDLVARAMRDSTLAPGKRMRPMLLVLAARGLGCPAEQALELGCAIEMVHAASLVLDDMPCMDNAQLRRGQPTTHIRYGEDVAILSAVALLSRAFGVVASTPGLAPEVRTQVVLTLANAVGMQGLVRGQFEDLREGARPRSADEITVTNDLKTGVLFGATLQMAALLGGADEVTSCALQGFALELGQAFQLYDDLQDNCADNAKDQGKDQGKSTLVALLGEAHVRERLHAHLQRAEHYLRQVFGEEQEIRCYVAGIFRRVVGGEV